MEKWFKKIRKTKGEADENRKFRKKKYCFWFFSLMKSVANFEICVMVWLLVNEHNIFVMFM